MLDEPWELESLRRSLVMCTPDGPATALSNRDAVELIGRLQLLEQELGALRSGVAAALHRNTPVPLGNARLRRLCVDLGRLLATSEPPEGRFR